MSEPGRTSELSTGQAVTRVLAAYGVETVFGIPGTHNLELYRDLRELGIRPITARHEQGAGYAADGWAVRSGRPGIVITTSGPGLLNVLSAAASAYCESRPLLILTPGPPLRGHEPDSGAMHETRSTVEAMRGVTEHARVVRSPAEAVEAVHEAFHLFATARPRPVSIEIPLDVLAERGPVPAEILERRDPGSPPAALVGPDAPGVVPPAARTLAAADIRVAGEVLRAAVRPVIIAGRGAATASSELVALAERLQSPVLSSVNGKGVIPESHPLSLGASLRLPRAARVVAESDCLLVVGSKLGEGDLWETVLRPGGATIRLDIDARQLARSRAEVQLLGDATAVLPLLLAELSDPRPELARSSTLLPASTRLPASAEGFSELAVIRAELAAEAAAISPILWDISSALCSALPSGAVLTGDSSQITYLGTAATFRAEEPGTFIFMPTYATLGYGLPAAIGAKLASPGAPVVCALGDGALMFSVQEFATAVEAGLDLVVVCVDNGGYGEIRENQRDLGISPVSVDLHQPDWVALARSFGGEGSTACDAASLGRELRAALADGGVRLIHVRVADWEASAAA